MKLQKILSITMQFQIEKRLNVQLVAQRQIRYIRNIKEVTNWLKEYLNLEIVSRDGSLSFKNAIEKANKKIIQVGDRFHIFKNLIDYCKEYILNILLKRK